VERSFEFSATSVVEHWVIRYEKEHELLRVYKRVIHHLEH
jgi:hypothetical protein